jgi:carboxylate-amine ligase
MLICGMHVHVGIEDDEVRLELMNAFTPFLPLLLA